jgi:hypothetical protein
VVDAGLSAGHHWHDLQGELWVSPRAQGGADESGRVQARSPHSTRLPTGAPSSSCAGWNLPTSRASSTPTAQPHPPPESTLQTSGPRRARCTLRWSLRWLPPLSKLPKRTCVLSRCAGAQAGQNPGRGVTVVPARVTRIRSARPFVAAHDPR